MPNFLALAREGRAAGEQRRFNSLAGQAYAAPEADRNALLTQAVGIDPGAGLKLQDTLQERDDGTMRRAVGAARYMKQAIDSKDPAMIQGAFLATKPFIEKLTGKVLPPQWSEEMLPGVHQVLAMGEGATNKNGLPTGFREFDMTAQAAGLQPGTPEYQQAAQVALGMRGRAATGGFGFKEITGADGRTRWARQNPRTGTMEIYDETTGEFVPLGGGAPLNPGGAPAAVPQAAPQAAPGGGSSASNLGSPITMPTDLNTAFASLSNSFPGTQITSTTRTPEHNREVGGVANSQHLRGTAADFAVPAAQRPAFIEAARRQGFEAIDEGDHVHLELPPGARAPAARPGLGVSRSPEEQAALTTAAQEQAKINAEIGAYTQMTGLEADRAAQVSAATAGAKTQAEVNAQQGARARDAGQVLTLLSEAEKLIPKSTGSSAGALVDTIAGAGGTATEGAKAIAQLRTIAGQLTSKMPRMEGPQSNADVEMYRQMAGDLANPSSPREVRMAALQTIRQLNQKYAAQNAAGPQNPSAPRAPARPITEADFNALPSGATFIDPDDGKTYRKP
ncbi:D-Ala-D-Ala carboxypeptidase family metallohydrolase [Lysobacter capsici]|nr:D-Ala-D-Ala carboxypeptidase family metallohydrolase [Lysobacter capsici]WND79382.1 D-Ala-D-Ala carboxypeptidase family metallohydrolase [Lysobacter capsici]WND84578.1 D-Ala-D-Ala carboxypeptidase family metallohydrolase [Lysobacter capsici]